MSRWRRQQRKRARKAREWYSSPRCERSLERMARHVRKVLVELRGEQNLPAWLLPRGNPIATVNEDGTEIDLHITDGVEH